jgi:glycosyltransferase involved in cell wall biosynthesis
MVAACPFPLERGTPIRIERLARSLGDRGHHVDVFTYHHGSNRPSEGLNIIRVRGTRRYRRTAPGPSVTKIAVLDPQLAWRLYRSSQGGRYDLIHAHHVEGLMVSQLAGRLHNLPIVYDVHTLLGSELPFYDIPVPDLLLRKLGRVIDRALPRMAHHVIAVSEEIVQAIAGHSRFLSGRISCIPNGVEDELFPSAPAQELYRGSIVFAGNFGPYQGIEHLLDAFAVLRERKPSARLLMVSESDFTPYRAQAERLGILDGIDFTSVEVAQLGGVLAKAGIAINPRVNCAGLPQKLLNYMAAGCAIVSFSGSAKHIQHGTSALIVPDADIGAMAAAMERLIDDPALARKIGQRAQDMALDELSWERTAARVEQVYDSLLERK